MHNKSRLESWKHSISLYEQVFTMPESQNFADRPLKIIKEINSILEEKITIYAIGQSKAGKSKILNALIGNDLLEMDEQNCTFFGLKIHSNHENPIFIYKNEKIQGDNEIKAHIQNINKKERENIKYRDQNENCDFSRTYVPALKTPFKAFRREKTYAKIGDAYNLIEFVDLPGISDNILGYEKEYTENLKNFTKLARKGEDPTAKTKFHDIVNQLPSPDIILLILACNQMDKIKKFKNYFFNYMFNGEKRSELEQIITKKRIIVILNKRDIIDKENNNESDLKMQKEKNITRIFLELFSKLIGKEKKNYEDITNNPDFKIFQQQFKIVFTSAQNALDNIMLTPQEINRIKAGDPKLTDNDMKKLSEHKKKNENYEKSKGSGYEELIEAVSEKINEVFEEKFQYTIELNLNELKKEKKSFDSKFEELIDKTNSLKINWENIDKEIQKTFKMYSDQIKDIIKKLPKKLTKIKNAVKLVNVENITSAIHLFKKKFEKTFEKIDKSIELYNDNMLKNWKEYKEIENYLMGKIKFALIKLKKKKTKLNSNIIYAFLPENIPLYYYWIAKIINFFFGSSFQRKWKYFESCFEEKLENAKVMLKNYSNEIFVDFIHVEFLELWKRCKLVNNIN